METIVLGIYYVEITETHSKSCDTYTPEINTAFVITEP